MPAYIMLMNITDQGMKSIKQAPERVDAGIKAFEATGGKVTAFYATLGAYDYVAIGEAPSEEAGVAFSLSLGSQGNVRVTTLRGFNAEEFAKIVDLVP
jgi:uncharacterized protein with GYD domain